jgi:hypothetical protein
VSQFTREEPICIDDSLVLLELLLALEVETSDEGVKTHLLVGLEESVLRTAEGKLSSKLLVKLLLDEVVVSHFKDVHVAVDPLVLKCVLRGIKA